MAGPLSGGVTQMISEGFCARTIIIPRFVSPREKRLPPAQPRSNWALCSGRPMRSDGEDKLDLADIGGETGTAAHGASIALPGRMPKTPAAAALARSVLCEQGLGFAILVVVSVLGTWPPAIHASGHRSGGADLAIPHHPVDR
jgi:hypothetical protein